MYLQTILLIEIEMNTHDKFCWCAISILALASAEGWVAELPMVWQNHFANTLKQTENSCIKDVIIKRREIDNNDVDNRAM